MSLEELDAVVLDNFPVVPAPHHGKLPEPEKPGQRYIVGKHGLYRQVSTPWLESVVQISAVDGLTTPYGDVVPVNTLKCDSPPKQLWVEFVKAASLAAPKECAGLMIWNEETFQWRFALREAVVATNDYIQYNEPELGAGEIAVVDVHSHGHHAAFFSATDNTDDRGGIKVAAVLGNLDHPAPSVAIRLVCLDAMFDMRLQDGQLTFKGAAS